MRSIVLEDNSNSLRYWIYTLLITTYRMNKRGFDCALSFLRFSSSLSPFFPLFFSSILPRLLALFFLFFLSCTPSGFEPLTFLIHLAYQSFFYTNTPRDSVEVYPRKLIFILLDSLACTKNSITIYLFICLTHAACCTPARKHPSHLWVLGE